MKRYDMGDSYEPYTGQHQGIVGIESDSGRWCKVEDALKVARQRDQLRWALELVLNDALFTNPAVIEQARAALKETSE